MIYRVLHVRQYYYSKVDKPFLAADLIFLRGNFFQFRVFAMRIILFCDENNIFDAK